MNDEPLLRMEGIRKVFSGVVALDGVDFRLERGEVHALVGENGAGKSTLIKVMTGAYRRDGGRVLLEGREVNFRSPEEAQEHGVVAVYQEVNLLAFRTVAENIFLGREPRRLGFIDWKRMNADADATLKRLGLDIDARAPLGSLNIALRQMVAIARGVSARREGRRARRADQLAHRARGLHPLRRHTAAEGRGRRRRLHQPPLRRAVRGLRSRDRPARRPLRRHAPARRAGADRPRLPDARQAARGVAARRRDRLRRAPCRSRARAGRAVCCAPRT